MVEPAVDDLPPHRGELTVEPHLGDTPRCVVIRNDAVDVPVQALPAGAVRPALVDRDHHQPLHGSEPEAEEVDSRRHGLPAVWAESLRENPHAMLAHLV